MEKMGYDFPKLEAIAARIEQEISELIQAGDWEQIAEIISVPESVWHGPAADSYRKICEKIVSERDDLAIYKTSYAIYLYLEDMKKLDLQHAKTIEEGFSDIIFP